MAKQTIPEAVAALCLAFPETDEKVSHGAPTWTVGGKQFACFSLNHHGDGHVGLLLKVGSGEQHRLVESDPALYYIPAYYGPSGWVGIELNGDVDWAEVVTVTAEAWRAVATPAIERAFDGLPPTPKPRPMKPEEIDPFVAGTGAKLLARLETICLALPETTPDDQFGAPCFRVGKKNFATLHPDRRGGFWLQAWVGEDRQAMLTFDDRYRIPAYIGRNGWIELKLEARPSWAEVNALVRESYAHFATKRALKALAASEQDAEQDADAG